MRATPSVIVANDLAAGMEQVLVELRSAVIPPICSRVISVVNEKGDQDLYFVGFGSAVIRMNKNKNHRKKAQTSFKEPSPNEGFCESCGFNYGRPNGRGPAV